MHTKGHVRTVEVLLEAGADLQQKDEFMGQTVLHRAADGGHDQAVQALLDRGADIDAVDDNGYR